MGGETLPQRWEMADPEFGWGEEPRASGGSFSTALRGRSEEGCSSDECGGACRKRKTRPSTTSVFLVAESVGRSWGGVCRGA